MKKKRREKARLISRFWIGDSFSLIFRFFDTQQKNIFTFQLIILDKFAFLQNILIFWKLSWTIVGKNLVKQFLYIPNKFQKVYENLKNSFILRLLYNKIVGLSLPIRLYSLVFFFA